MKTQVLMELKANLSSYVSGEALSSRLNVSRTAVWKHINELKRDGYEIISSTKKGYLLVNIPDIIAEEEITRNLDTDILGKKLIILNKIDSTNNYAKRLGNEDCPDGTVVIADCQSDGRGRLGRHWSSLPGKGIWMSVVIRPDIEPSKAQIFTIGAATAVAAAIYKATGIKTGIKWPNDLILNGRKVCGILTEMNSEIDRVNFLVLGIGINVSHMEQDFPQELKEVATSIKMNMDGDGSPVPLRCDIIKNVLYELERIYSKINKGLIPELIDDWKNNSITLGREVRVLMRNEEIKGTAIDITGEGKLVIKCSNGKLLEVHSGEVSVKGILGEN